MYNFRTDLANERRDLYQKVNGKEGEIDGIESSKEDINENLKIERVKITNENGEKIIGKPIGTYITIDIKNLKIAQDEEIDNAANVLSNELINILDNLITSTLTTKYTFCIYFVLIRMLQITHNK